MYSEFAAAITIATLSCLPLSRRTRVHQSTLYPITTLPGRILAVQELAFTALFAAFHKTSHATEPHESSILGPWQGKTTVTLRDTVALFELRVNRCLNK